MATCETCTHYAKGFCKWQYEAPTPKRNVNGESFERRWPHVLPDDFCGAHEAKKKKSKKAKDE